MVEDPIPRQGEDVVASVTIANDNQDGENGTRKSSKSSKKKRSSQHGQGILA